MNEKTLDQLYVSNSCWIDGKNMPLSWRFQPIKTSPAVDEAFLSDFLVTNLLENREEMFN